MSRIPPKQQALIDLMSKSKKKASKTTKKRVKPTFNGIEFDSQGEIYFYWYLQELISEGLITELEMQPESFILSKPIKHTYIKQLVTKTKEIEQSLVRGNIYTPDFKFKVTPKGLASGMFVKLSNKSKLDFIKPIITEDNYCFLELKPDQYDLKFEDSNNMVRLARNKQKQVYDKHNVYINIIFHNRHFSKTFTPRMYIMSDGGNKLRSLKYTTRTLKQYLSTLNC